MNVYNLDKSGHKRKELGTLCNQHIQVCTHVALTPAFIILSVPTWPSHQRLSFCLYHVTFISVHHHLSWTENSLVFQSMWKKDFTLEFSRDRKSMSCCATPIKQTKLGPGPKFFVKVRDLHPCVYKHLLWKRWWGRRTMMRLFCVVGRSRGRAGQMYLCARRYTEGSHDTSPQSGDHEARQVLRNRYVPCGELHHVIKLR